MKTYRLSKVHLFINILIAFLFTGIFGGIAIKEVLKDGRVDSRDVLLLLVVVGLLGSGWSFGVVRIILEIAINDDGRIEFRSLIGSKFVRASEIQSIHSEFYSYGTIIIRHTGGTIRVLYNLDGMHEFIATTKNMNPQVATWDC